MIELEPRRLLSAYVVNDSGDLPLDPAKGPGETVNGTISLRSAIQQVDIDGSGSIGFASKMTIMTSGLPVVTARDVTIDGGSLGSVEIKGNGDSASGLVFAGDDAVITGLEIVGFGGDGIDVGATGATIGGTAGGAGNAIFGNVHLGLSLGSFGGSAVVEGNFIGTDAVGKAGLGNGESGIYIGSAGNTIGGPSAAARNVISGNAADGVDIAGASATGNVVEGDYIGTNAAGTAALANYNGVDIEGGASDNLIGTNGDGVNDAAERDIISGNLYDGVWINGSETDGNVVAGDFIGTDVTGMAAVGNDSIRSDTGGGVEIGGGAFDNLIGTSGRSNDDSGQRNVVSGNGNDGVDLYGAGTGGNVVAGNFIGTNAAGTAALQNAFLGMWLLDLTATNYVGVNPLYGAPSADQQNVISGNEYNGIEIYDTSGSVVAGNLIGTNAAGTAAIPNVLYSGIYIEHGSTYNLVGSLGEDGAAIDALERNVISGNNLGGVEISGAGTSGNVVAGNYIGLDRTGTSAVGNGQAGVVLEAGATDNTIGGLTAVTRNVIGGNGNRGVYISTPANSTTPTTRNVVEGNYIGTDASGLVPMGNNLNDAVSINLSPGNTIGGTVAGAGNVLDAGDDSGVFIYGDDQRGPFASAAANLIAGNIIGLAADGETAAGFGNQYDGIVIDSAPDTTIGGTVAAARNIISNNTNHQGAGILITNFEEPDGSHGTVVQGNFIGTDITGTRALGNDIGVDIEGASSAVVGIEGQDVTTGSPGGNVISGNLTAGIIINATPANVGGAGTSLPGAADNIVAGNLIGTTADGNRPLGNTGDGVRIEGGATGNTIGGTSAGAGNVIAFNAGNGVTVGLNAFDAAVGDAVLGNSIFSNAGSGLVVDNTAPQPAPMLTSAIDNGSLATITGTVTGAPDATYRIEFFSNPAGTSQGRTYLGFVNVTTNGSGSGSFSFSPAPLVAAGLNITATATDPSGNTSEFSKPVTVQSNIISELNVTYGGYGYNRVTRRFTQIVTIKNISGAAIAGPIELVLLNLKNATLVNASGTTAQGDPYITILSSGALGVGRSLTITLTFVDPTLAPISYTPEFLAGPVPDPD